MNVVLWKSEKTVSNVTWGIFGFQTPLIRRVLAIRADFVTLKTRNICL